MRSTKSRTRSTYFLLEGEKQSFIAAMKAVQILFWGDNQLLVVSFLLFRKDIKL